MISISRGFRFKLSVEVDNGAIPVRFDLSAHVDGSVVAVLVDGGGVSGLADPFKLFSDQTLADYFGRS